MGRDRPSQDGDWNPDRWECGERRWHLLDCSAQEWVTEYATVEQMERDDLLMTMNGWVRHGG